MAVQKTHVTYRTNKKGENYLGTCVLCGTTNLSITDTNKPCPNPNNMFMEDAMRFVSQRKQ